MHDPCQIQIDCSAIEKFKTGENGTFKRSKCRAHGDEVPRRNPSGYVSLPVTHRESFSLVLQEKAMPVVHRERDPSSSPPPHEDFVAYATDLAERSILFLGHAPNPINA